MSKNTVQAEPELRLAEPLPNKFVVGRGQYQILRGTIYCTGLHISELLINQSNQRYCRVELFPGDDKYTLEFVISILWTSTDVGERHNLSITLRTEPQTQSSFELGSIELVDTLKKDTLPGHTIGDSPLIAICMASYNPASDRLVRQIESILCQSYGNWLLIISDDNSDKRAGQALEALCKLDPRRIRLYRHDQNLGFYLNFERALGYVPDNAELIAFADQDDEWYPEKLTNLVQELNNHQDTVLVYSDMRIVSASGALISITYWQQRNNEYRDFNTIFLANTVTGAASLFKRELLDVVLPFPAPNVGAFHDHWIACSAMCLGGLSYVDDPLYDYIQYEDSIIGHCDFRSASAGTSFANLLNSPEKGVRSSVTKWQQVYRQDCLRLKNIGDTLKIRVPQKSANHTLNLMNGGGWSAIKLAWAYLAGRIMRRTTNGAELGLIMGVLRGRGR